MQGQAAWQHVLLEAGYVREGSQGPWLPGGDGDGSVFAYTDGEALELALLEQLQRTTDRSVLSPALLAEVADWPRRYHFSPRRANLLRPLESFLRGRKVLEIGAGCGAISRYLGEIGCELLALEGSPARARVAAARCAGLDKVSVLADTLQNFPQRTEFEVVSLIGVLEYARIFFPAAAGQDPVDAMLAYAAGFLAPGGVLLVAIENQLGLKYFAGYREDHLNEPMLGIEDRYPAGSAVTFGRHELGQRLAAAGLPAQQCFYPLPDYKLPVAVLSEEAVSPAQGAHFAALASGAVAADLQTPSSMSFALEAAWAPVMRNGLGGELANSLLLVAGRQRQQLHDPAELAWHYAVERAPAYAKRTVFRRHDEVLWVEPQALCPQVRPAAQLKQQLVRAPFTAGRLWHQVLFELLNQPGWRAEQLVPWCERWLRSVEALLAESAPPQGEGVPLRGELDAALPGWMLDAVPRNLIVRGSEASFIDLEWNWAEGVSLGHLCFRAIVHSLTAVASVAQPADEADRSPLHLFGHAMKALGFADVEARVPHWHEQECAFQLLATGVEVPRSLAALQNHRLAVRKSAG